MLTDHVDDEPQRLDLRVQRFMRARDHASVQRAFRIVSLAGTAPVYATATVMATASLASRVGARRALPVALAPVGAVISHTIIKRLVGRERPPEAIEDGNHKPSFPSGHTTRATAVSLTIGYALMRQGLASRDVAVPVAVAIPLLVGVSRAYTHRHWSTDVLAGWSLGLIVAALSASWMEGMGDE